jgi:TolA-binding protein
VYSDHRVKSFIAQHFVPVRVHVREQAEEFQRLGEQYAAKWTPTVLVLNANGEERHRIEGYLPTEEFLPQLALGLAHADFTDGEFGEAERRFRQIVDEFAASAAAPEAVYWAGVSRYKRTGEAAALTETARQFTEKYQESTWAKKSRCGLLESRTGRAGCLVPALGTKHQAP